MKRADGLLPQSISGERASEMACCKKGLRARRFCGQREGGREGGGETEREAVIVLTESVWILWIWQTEVVPKG